MTQPLVDFSRAVSDIVERAAPSLLRVHSRRAPTTAFAVSEDGLIVTAAHAVERAECGVELPSGEEVEAHVVGRGGGVALLRVEATDLRLSAFRDADTLKTGEIVIGVARAEHGVRAALGVLSEVGPGFTTHRGVGMARYLQTNFDVYPGFSGSLALDAEGRAIGMNHAGILRGVPLIFDAATLGRLATSLREHGGLRRGYLGVGAHPIELPKNKQAELGQAQGLLLVKVEEGGPAERAGLFLGDVLVAIDGTPLTTLGALVALLGDASPQKTLAVEALRCGELTTLELTPGEREQ